MGIIFYINSFIILLGVLGVLMCRKPLHGALCFMVSMLGVASVFFDLNAFFLGGVQLAVYAGAVTVLFVILLMVFDFNKGDSGQSYSGVKLLLRFLVVGLPLGTFVGAIVSSYFLIPFQGPKEFFSVEALGRYLFGKFFVPFQAMGLLLLVIAVGVVCIAKWKEVYDES